MRNALTSWVVRFLTCIVVFDTVLLTATASTGLQDSTTSPLSTTSSTLRDPKVPVVEQADKDHETLASSQSVNISLPEWKRQLPVELQNKTKTLQRIIVPGPNGRRVQIYLLGTAHVSIDSSRDVRMLLEAVQPSILFLELCDQRIPMLLTQPTTPPATPPETTATTKRQGFWGRLQRKKSQTSSPPPEGSRSMYGMAAGLLTNMQQDYAQSLGVELGGEFRVAYNYWDEQRQQRRIHMILGDRPLYLTLTRAWESLGPWGKIKLVVGLIISSLQKPNPDELREWMQKILSDDTGDLLSQSIAELGKHFPSLERVIIQERDAYMACKLYQTCRQLLRFPPRSADDSQVQTMVAIVGAGHIQGVCRILTQNDGKRPEDMLAPLIEIKKGLLEDDRQALIYEVMEVNAEQLQAISKELSAPSTIP